MQVYIVMRNDYEYDPDVIDGVYATEELANEHIETKAYSDDIKYWIEEYELLTEVAKEPEKNTEPEKRVKTEEEKADDDLLGEIIKKQSEDAWRNFDIQRSGA